jgi:hypothetical protein
MLKIYKKHHQPEHANRLYQTYEVGYGAWRDSKDEEKRNVFVMLWFAWERLVGRMITIIAKLRGIITQNYAKNSLLQQADRQPDRLVLGWLWQAIVKRKIMLLSLAFLVILIPIAYLTLRYSGKTEAAWYDDNYAYRQRVDITNSLRVLRLSESETGSAQTDYQVAHWIEINYKLKSAV